MKLSVLLHLREVRTRTLCNGFSYSFYLSTEAAVAPSNVTAISKSSTVILVEWKASLNVDWSMATLWGTEYSMGSSLVDWC